MLKKLSSTFLSVIYSFILLSSLLISYGVAFDVQAKVDNLSLGHLSVADGLAQGTINKIFQDNEGFIWIGSENGIDIYDGYKVKSLPGPDNDFSIFSNYLIKQDSKGLMWLNLIGKGLYTFDAKTNNYQLIYSAASNDNKYEPVDVIETINNHYLIVTKKSIGLYDYPTGQYQEKIDLNGELNDMDNIQTALLDDNILYIATRGGTYVYNITSTQWRKLPDLTNTTADSRKFELTNATKTYNLHINQKVLYLGTNDGVFTVDISNISQYLDNTFVLPPYDLAIEHISTWQFVERNSKLYISSNLGLSVLDLTDNSSEFLFGLSDYAENITDNTINSLFIDNKGLFWLGSASIGLFTWDPKRALVKNFRYRRNSTNSLTHNSVSHMLQQSNDQNVLWVSTLNGLNKVNLQSNKVEKFMVSSDTKNAYNQSNIFQVDEFNNQLWLSTVEGLVLFDLATQKNVDLPFDKPVNARLADEINSIYIEEEFLWFIELEKITKVSMTTGEVDELSELNNAVGKGKLWKILGYSPNSKDLLLTTNNALWRYNVDERKALLLYQQANVTENEWSSIDSWVIEGDILWLAFSGQGLVGLSASTFELKHFYHKGNSIIDNNVYGVMTDDNHNIWFSTHQGIHVLNPKTQHIRQFTMKDGFATMEYNAGAYIKLADNRLVYGSMEGISIFDPITLSQTDNSAEFNVHITEIELLSRDLPLPLVINNNDVIPLLYDDVGIRIDLSTFFYGYNDNVFYQYNLTGKSKVEYPPTRENHITFASLASGKHSLEIRAISPLTGEYSTPFYLHFTVSYAPWSSPTAYFIYALFVILLISLWMRYRHIQQKLLLDAHEQVKYRENRLQLALTGSNSEVWDWQSDDNLMFGKRIALELGYKDKTLFYSFAEHVELIHPDDRNTFLMRWEKYLKNSNLDENFSCTYRLKTQQGKWLWYKDLGKIVAIDAFQQPSRITGSYTNITESIANEERSQYYGDAFKRTQDWVLIVDEQLTRVTANRSMREVFEWPDEEFAFNIQIFGLEQSRQKFYKNLLSSLKEGEHWRGEELINTPNNQEYHVIVNISVGKNSVSNNIHYLFVLTDISAQKSAEKELRYLANYDHLTNLPNRSLLLDRIKHGIDYSNRNAKSIALFFIDLDRFKQVNDSLGHDCGDLLLQEITQRLTKTLRADDTVARIGGDEFVILLESFTSINQLGRIAQKVIDVVGQPIKLNNNIVSVGASIGISLYPDDAKNSADFLRNADVAMYHAKQSGRNCFQFFTDEMNSQAQTRLSKESKLKLAVTNGEFINHYQPIVDAHTGKAIGFELLLRWSTAEGIIMPSKFIALSEELGIIIPMTEAALDRGLRALKQWHVVRPDLYLSVNLAPQHFAKESLVPYIKKILLTHDLPAHFLKIEVTESALLSEPEKAISTMYALTELGVKLALDDFGTGFSSLSYLKKLPLEIIKIDRIFVSGIGKNEADEAIVDATLVLAKRLNMYCIAEGVETEEQLQYLVGQRCHYIQGYFYDKPMSGQDVIKKLLFNKTEGTVAAP